MNIVGMGTEIVECARIGRLIQQHGERFLRSVYTDREIAYCNRQPQSLQHFAARWTAKAAVVKALDVHAQQIGNWCEIEIRGSIRRQPTPRFAGPIRRAIAAKSIARIVISAAFSRSVATATAIAIGR